MAAGILVRTRKGFTLIEILVVVAIIGVLSAVVLNELNVARGRARDAAIRSSIGNARAQVELYLASQPVNTASYIGACNSPNGLGRAQQSAAEAGSLWIDCQDNITGWYIAAQLHSNQQQWYCADWRGYAGVITRQGLNPIANLTQGCIR